MRLAPGDVVLLFDGINGEFSAEIVSLGKKTGAAAVRARTCPAPAADVWLLFAPVKKDRTDFIIEKATELGAGKIIPVITRHTITDKVRVERLRAQAAEAAEQSRRVEVPEIGAPVRLEKLLADWDSARRLFCGRKRPRPSRCGSVRGISGTGGAAGRSGRRICRRGTKRTAVASLCPRGQSRTADSAGGNGGCRGFERLAGDKRFVEWRKK